MTRAAVAARLREKRLLKAAMFAMSRREREVDALAFQVDARAAEKRDAEAALAARKKRAAALAERYNTPLVLATLDVEVVQSEAGATEHRPAGSRFTASAVVREGDDIEAIARAFAEKHAVDASAVPTLIAALQPGTPARAARADAARARLVAAVPVVVPSGAYGVLAMRKGDDLQDIARVFAGLHEIPEASIPGLVADANATLALRARLPVLLRMPLTVPDGRSLALEVREGDQHGELAAPVDVAAGLTGHVAGRHALQLDVLADLADHRLDDVVVRHARQLHNLLDLVDRGRAREDGLPLQHLGKYAPHRPHVDRKAVSRRAQQDLWRAVPAAGAEPGRSVSKRAARGLRGG